MSIFKLCFTLLILLSLNSSFASGGGDDSYDTEPVEVEEVSQCPEVCEEQCTENDEDGNCINTEEVCSQPTRC